MGFEEKTPDKDVTVISISDVEAGAVIDKDVGLVLDKDTAILEAIGYKQEFKREFSVWSTFGLAFSVMGVLPSIATCLSYNMGNAGFVGMTWGWLAASVFVNLVALSMAELCSSLPTAGGLYYASAVLAPKGWGPLFAWITGWSNFVGLSSFLPSVDYSLSNMILACVSIRNPSYVPKSWHTFLLFVALLLTHAGVASMPTKVVSRLNSISTIFNLVAIVIFVVVVPAASRNRPKTNSPKPVWTELDNTTEWPAGVAFIMSFLTVVWTEMGYDAPFHISEECSNANIACPRAIRWTAFMGSLLGFFIMLVISYTVKDIPSVMASPVGQPMASFLQQVLGDKGALGMMSLIIICLWFVGQGCLVAASRVAYAYSRDGVLPFSSYFAVVSKRFHVPIRAVWLLFSIAFCFGLLSFNSIAIGAVFSVGAIAQYIAFTVPIFAKLISTKFKPGPFYLGKFSKINNAVSCGFVVVMVPIFCFPTVRGLNLTPENMNYTCLVYGGPITLALIWYATSARKWFIGPRVSAEHLLQAVEQN